MEEREEEKADEREEITSATSAGMSHDLIDLYTPTASRRNFQAIMIWSESSYNQNEPVDYTTIRDDA